MPELTGRCACGAVTWRTPGPVLWAGHCHCESCRRASSAPVMSFFGVPRQAVIWTGEIAARPSSGTVNRGYCPACGAQLYIQATRWPDETHLYAATLDDPGQFEPRAHFHWDERVAWLTVDDDLPKFASTADGAEPVA